MCSLCMYQLIMHYFLDIITSFTMWLERTVMFQALHSTIRDVLGSDENIKVQFILEPLAFPLLSNCLKFYGQRFIDQLSYITRTFVFYIDREYKKKIRNWQKMIPPNQ